MLIDLFAGLTTGLINGEVVISFNIGPISVGYAGGSGYFTYIGKPNNTIFENVMLGISTAGFLIDAGQIFGRFACSDPSSSYSTMNHISNSTDDAVPSLEISRTNATIDVPLEPLPQTIDQQVQHSPARQLVVSEVDGYEINTLGNRVSVGVHSDIHAPLELSRVSDINILPNRTFTGTFDAVEIADIPPSSSHTRTMVNDDVIISRAPARRARLRMDYAAPLIIPTIPARLDLLNLTRSGGIQTFDMTPRSKVDVGTTQRIQKTLLRQSFDEIHPKLRRATPK
jgi:hypothetical protein